MQTAEGSQPSDQVDRVSALLEELLETKLVEQGNLLDQLCARYPDCALALRMGYASLQQMDLLQVGQSAPAAAESAPLASSLPRPLGSFLLLELLGAGGMGTVYRAEDLELKRDVALKLVRGELLASVRTRSRFQRESEALARLDHPGLCTVYRAGTTDGQPWIAMRLVRGTTLAAHIEARKKNGTDGFGKRNSSQSREELQHLLLLFEKIARALASAHAVGVVHRDLKPANIVLTSGDEPVVIDFGLVHLEDSGPHLTASGDHIGTPAYMAPEQVEAKGREPGPGTDVYSLGVTLFEALTLESPYAAQGREELFHCIVRGERRRLRRVRSTLPPDLEVVLEKALDLDPARRYASMIEFADDLRRLRQHEPPAARRIGRGLRLRRWCQRNPVAATFLTLLSLGLGAALAFGARLAAEERHSLAMAWGNLSGQLVDENPEHALDLALRGIDLEPGDPESAGHLLRALQEVHPHEVWPLPWPSVPGAEIKKLIVAPRGDAALILGDINGKVIAPVLWRNGTTKTLQIPGGTLDADWSVDSEWFLTAGPQSPPQLWSAAGEWVADFHPPDAPPAMPIPRARFLRGSDFVVFACSDGIARIHDRAKNTWQGLAPSLCRGKLLFGLAVSEDGARIALGDRDGRIVVHETDRALALLDGTEIVPASQDDAAPTAQGSERIVRNFELDFGAGGQLLQSFSRYPRCRSLWTWEGKPLTSWGSLEEPAPPMALDETHGHVLEATQGHEQRLWRMEGGELVFHRDLAGHDGRVSSCSFAADGGLLTTGVDGTARLWDANSGRQRLVLRGFDQELRACAFLGDASHCLLVTTNAIHRFDLRSVAGPQLQVGSFRDRHVRFLSPPWPASILTADDVRRLSLHEPTGHLLPGEPEPFIRRSGLDLATDGHWLVTTSYDHEKKTKARIYSPGLLLAHQIDNLPMVEPVPIFGPDDHLLLLDVNTRDRAALYVTSDRGAWRLAPDEVQRAFSLACEGAEAVAYHAPTSTLAVALPSASVTLFQWSASPPSLANKLELLPGQSMARKIAFTLDGQQLLLACKDRVVRLVDRSQRVRARISGHVGTIVDVGVSPHGDRLLVAASESGVAVCDLNGKLILPIRPRTGGVTMAAFVPEGDQILYATTERITRVVPFDPDRLEELARAVVKPATSKEHWRSYGERIGDNTPTPR